MSLDASQVSFVRRLVHERSGIVVDTPASSLLEIRLAAVAREAGLASASELIGRISGTDGSEWAQLAVESVLNNETSFFRDHHPFEALRTNLLPDLLARRGGAPLQIWSAACAAGQEPYSLAMLLEDHFSRLPPGAVRILATDLSRRLLARAREGLYSQLEVNRGLPAACLVRHFRQEGTQWRIREEARRRVEFRNMNLFADWKELPPMDLVLLRNVMIYFDEATRRATLARLRRVLRPDGWLVLGSAESLYGLDAAYDCVSIGSSTAYRLRGPGRAAP